MTAEAGGRGGGVFLATDFTDGGGGEWQSVTMGLGNGGGGGWLWDRSPAGWIGEE